MRSGLRCIFPNIVRIPAECADKSIFKASLQQPTADLLRQVADSQIHYLSPFDSAAILDRIVEKSDHKGISEIRRSPFYRPVVSKITSSVQRYRTELLYYFLVKFYKLHDVSAIKSITRTFVESQAVKTQNVNQLVELLYYAAHHIPKELQSAQVEKESKQEADDRLESSEPHLSVFCESIQQLQREIIPKVAQVHDGTLIYKLVTTITRLPETQHTRTLTGALLDKVKLQIEKGTWNHQQLVKVVKSILQLWPFDRDILQKVIRALEINEDNLSASDIRTTLQLLDDIGAQVGSIWHNFKGRSEPYKMEPPKTTIIPTEMVLSLSKTHPLFQNDKVILSEEAAALIASTVEFRLKEIIQMAQRFMSKSCRYINKHPTLMPTDVRDALRTLRMENLHGYTNCYDYRYVTSSKLYKGNRVVKRESTMKSAVDERCWGRQRLSEIISTDMQKAIPAQPGLTVHWMIVNGIVPALANNMAQCVTNEFNQEARRQMLQLSLDHVNFLESTDASKQLADVEKLASKIKVPTLRLASRARDTVDVAIVESLQRHLGNSVEGTVDRSTDDKAIKLPVITIPKVEHILTKEQKFFLKEIKSIVKKASNTMDHHIQLQLRKVLSILRNSPALDHILPDLALFFVSELERDNESIEAVLMFAEAIAANSKIQIHFHVHQLVVPLLTVLLKQDEERDLQTVHRNLCVRRLAAKALGNVSTNLRDTKTGLEGIDNYLMNIYKRAVLDSNCTLPVLYGAFCGISQLPLAAKRIVFFPIVPLIMPVLYKKHLRAHDKYAKTGSKVEEFAFITCQEIVHLSMIMLYEACFEDILECIHDTGVFAVSHEAQIMIRDTLKGCAEDTVNPEIFLPIYCAILTRCAEILTPKREIDSEEATNSRLPEIENAEWYYSMYLKETHPGSQITPVQPTRRTRKKTHKAAKQPPLPWYIAQPTHSLTLSI
ncbi:transcription initiation factor TFIID complex subunit TAF6 [Babesia ovata]|uniref:Transcription initiation factor TFIID complex subunit TAF6 n=1 Tax=Babesia ovata TaxID=189622 RepID=A0A2H6K983_9APIC|nr:transcription initiation factor TFIID complex subunit TAF6 [Babesia ovata]GBE59564.1 transcription initiation factor TFIID complex subunit TAF6 [Babesia ovata]